MTLKATLSENDRLIVVGGCGGIGAAIVADARAAGAEIIVLDLAQSITARGHDRAITQRAIDVTDESAVTAAFSDIGPVRALINVFGYTGPLEPLADMSADTFDAIMSANLRGAFLCCRAGAGWMKQGGAILNVSTGIAAIGAAGYGPYAAAKAGLNAMTRVLAAELAPAICVNALAPGAVDTAFIRGGFGRGGSEEGPPARMSIEDYAKRTPLQRIARPQDISAPALFLVSPAAQYITGQVLHVNGGALMRD